VDLKCRFAAVNAPFSNVANRECGNLSRRLQHASKNWGDFGSFPRTGVKSTAASKHRYINALASEVARHQQVRKSADAGFNARRLHQKMPGPRPGYFLRGGGGSLSRRARSPAG
jgi:hypothetical protein